MNREQPPINDIELLSAYIDGELSAEERIELNNRLDNEPALQAELESLQATVDILHSLPTLKAPRDFRLDPDIYGQKSSRRILSFTTWRVVSAAGVAAAVLLIAGSLAVLTLSSEDANDTATSGSEIAFEQTGQPEDLDREQTEVSLQPQATTLEFESEATDDTGTIVPTVEQAVAEGDFADNESEASNDSFEEELDDEAAEETGDVATMPFDEPPLAAGAVQENAPAPGQDGMGGGPPEDILEAPEAFDGEAQAAGEAGRSSDAVEERDDDDRQTEEAQTTMSDSGLDSDVSGAVGDLPVLSLLGEVVGAIVALADLIFSALTGR